MRNTTQTLLCTFNLGDLTMVSRQDMTMHDHEADITLVSYMIDQVKQEAQTVTILSDDTDVFVLLVYFTQKLKITAHMQMERWDGT